MAPAPTLSAPWSRLVRESPDFAERVRAIFAAGTNTTIATLRADGSPRITAIELDIADGHITVGMMPASRKLADVRRDPRVAVHSPTLEPPSTGRWSGDAKLAGILVEVGAPPGIPDATAYELDLTEVVLTGLNESLDRLVIESWHPGRGYERVERE
jgi:hypothetical protein